MEVFLCMFFYHHLSDFCYGILVIFIYYLYFAIWYLWSVTKDTCWVTYSNSFNKSMKKLRDCSQTLAGGLMQKGDPWKFLTCVRGALKKYLLFLYQTVKLEFDTYFSMEKKGNPVNWWFAPGPPICEWWFNLWQQNHVNQRNSQEASKQ